MDEVVDLAQFELTVTAQQRHGDPPQRPAGQFFGVVDHRRQWRRIRSRRSSRPVPCRRGPQHSVDVAGLGENGPPALDQLTGLPIEPVELIDDDLAFPIECVAMGEREPGVGPGEPPFVVLRPSRRRGQCAIWSCVHGDTSSSGTSSVGCQPGHRSGRRSLTASGGAPPCASGERRQPPQSGASPPPIHPPPDQSTLGRITRRFDSDSLGNASSGGRATGT